MSGKGGGSVSPRPVSRRPIRWWSALASAVVIGLSGCGFSGLAFVKDTRLQVVAPQARALVQVPVTLRWRIERFRVVHPGTLPVSSSAGYFAVFVDRAPVRPGQTLRALADSDCRKTPGCPDASYLADRGVYTTTTMALTLAQVASLNSYQKVQTHEATIVLLDSTGHRIGESAWYVDFRTRAGIS